MKSYRYKCSDCNGLFSTKFELREHKNLHTGEFPFMCTICQNIFASVSDYVRHSTSYHFPTRGATYSTTIPVMAGTNDMGRIQSSEYVGIEECSGTAVVSDSEIIQASNSESCAEIKDTEKQEKLCTNTKSSVGFINKLDEVKKKQNKKNYSCDQCGIKFKSVKKYSQHKRDTHTFVCENCNNKYSSIDKLAKHVCFVSSDGEPFKCSCSLTFTKSTQFKFHIGSRPYSCCKCSMQFNRITNLVRHIRTHTKQKPYICKQCGRGFSQSTNLRNHASIHLGVKAIQCDECDFSCKTVGGLLKHKKKHQNGFMKQVNYVDKRKTSTEAIRCPVCNKEFPFKRNVGMHMKIHRRKESLCQECGKVFDSKSKLTTHSKACHGVPSVCQTCGKTFASSVLLAAHEKIHVAGKKFSCTKCCKTFSIKNYLVQHMKTHLQGKQFSCNTCGKLFKVAVSLKYHSKICVRFNVL